MTIKVQVKVLIYDTESPKDDACRICGNKELISELVLLYESKNWFCSKCNTLYVVSHIDWRGKTFLSNPNPNNDYDVSGLDMGSPKRAKWAPKDF